MNSSMVNEFHIWAARKFPRLIMSAVVTNQNSCLPSDTARPYPQLRSSLLVQIAEKVITA